MGIQIMIVQVLSSLSVMDLTDTLGFPSLSTVDRGQGTSMTSEGGWKPILGELYGRDTHMMKSRF